MSNAGKRTKPDMTDDPGPGAPLLDWIYDLVDLVHPPTPVPMYDEHLFVLVTPRVIETEAMEAAAKPMPMGPAQPAPVVRQCAAMADGTCCQPVQTPQQCSVAPCPVPQVASAVPGQVQLDVCVMCMDPAAWDKPITASWADLSPFRLSRSWAIERRPV